jgi:septum formation protein
MSNPLIYLASASPRRAALLKQLRVDYHVEPVAIDESHWPSELPAEYVVRLARAKAESLWEQLPTERRSPVMGADTTVALEGTVFGKPLDRTHGLEMLQSLSGKTHQVYTAVALRHAQGCDWRVSVSEVTFAPLTAADCEAYWNTGEPRDKAGAYAIQGLAATFITRLAGSYSGVVGLPIYETVELLRQIGWTMPSAPGLDG